MLVAVLCIVFSGCRSEEYTRAYDHAKEEGKSDFYAKAYAEQIAEGKGKIYAEEYAFALEVAFNNESETRLPDDKTMKIFAKIFAQERHEGQTFTYAARYARIYCDMIPTAIENGKDERFIHQFTRHFVRVENKAKKLFRHQGPEYIESFSLTYAMERTAGTTNEQAVKKAMDYANAKHKRNR